MKPTEHWCSSAHRWRVGGPAGRTHLTVGLHVLEGLHQTQGLVHTSADRKVIHTHVLHDTSGINDEQASAGQEEQWSGIWQL